MERKYVSKTTIDMNVSLTKIATSRCYHRCFLNAPLRARGSRLNRRQIKGEKKANTRKKQVERHLQDSNSRLRRYSTNRKVDFYILVLRLAVSCNRPRPRVPITMS